MNCEDIASSTADCLGRFLHELQAETGWPTELILAGAHGRIAALMLQHLGGQDTAKICEDMAGRMRAFPSATVMMLARAIPAGSA